MRCTRIDFEGYKRLAKTGCNVDGRILAFVGLNEVGKSSMLDGLVWLTDPSATALPGTFANRSHSVAEKSRMVWAKYELDEDDIVILSDLDLKEPPAGFILERRKDGTSGAGVLPAPKRNPKPFDEAASRLAASRKRLAAQFSTAIEFEVEEGEDVDEGESQTTPGDWADLAASVPAEPDSIWAEESKTAIGELANWLDEVAPTSRNGQPRDAKTAGLLKAALTIAAAPVPSVVARERMLERVPRFVLFGEKDRALSTEHPIEGETERDEPQPALGNLLRIADLDLHDLWGFIESSQGSNQESYIETANENLQEFFSQAWNQSNVAVRLKVDGHRLEVRLKELGKKGSVTDIEERSDGLRTFIALSAFLAAQHLSVPPILLIDEAETHLHYDAQADLVGVLLKQVVATQVFYTTHSPGCLPTDLGTGIRLLSKDKDQGDASNLRADFWTNEEPGFAPLLYAMGASAAAFSVCRRAVLSEGAADMVLLPTLIRLATGLSDLEYQIAPGLSNAHAYGMKVEEVAARVVYLSDGDGQGDKYRKALEEACVDPSRVFKLPPGAASEDLIHRDQYVEVVNSMLGTVGQVTMKDLKQGQPIAKALQDWSKQTGVKTPGHVAVAYAIVRQGDDIRLTAAGKKALVALHESFTKAFNQVV